MPGPTIMAHQVYLGGGTSIARILRGGQFAELMGPTGITGTRSNPSFPNTHDPQSTMARFLGRNYAAHRNGVAVQDPITGLWSQSLTFSPIPGAATDNPHRMAVYERPAGPVLLTSQLGFDNFLYTAWTTDGINWSQGHFGVAGGVSSTVTNFRHEGIVYFVSGATNLGAPRIFFMNLDTFVRGATFATNIGGLTRCPRFFSVDGRLFMAGQQQSNLQMNAWEFVLGTWIDSGILGLNITSDGNFSMFKLNGIVYGFYGESVAQSLRCAKYEVLVPGGPLVWTDLITPIPVLLRDGTGIGVPGSFRTLCFVDNQSTPGTAQPYVMFFPDDIAGAVPTLFQWNGEGAEMTVAASPQTTRDSTTPENLYGGGEAFNGSTTVASPLLSTTPGGNAQGTTGVLFSFSLWGDPVRIQHGAITGTITEGDVATQTPSGATGIVLRTSPNETWIQGSAPVGAAAWIDTELITFVGGPGGPVNQSAPATGGAADKTVDIRFALVGGTGKDVPVTGIAAIVPGSLTPDGTLGGDQLQDLVADGRTYQAEWDFFANGIVDGSFDNIQLTAIRP